jgi:hypothetical protein
MPVDGVPWGWSLCQFSVLIHILSRVLLAKLCELDMERGNAREMPPNTVQFFACSFGHTIMRGRIKLGWHRSPSPLSNSEHHFWPNYAKVCYGCGMSVELTTVPLISFYMSSFYGHFYRLSSHRFRPFLYPLIHSFGYIWPLLLFQHPFQCPYRHLPPISTFRCI